MYTMTETLHCPICRRPVKWEGNLFRPFCSERCQTIDLGSWAAGWYRVPGNPLTIETDPADKSE
jgi:endogenous inhibitor of DNA gyrase (YacG/DUF329 family)